VLDSVPRAGPTVEHVNELEQLPGWEPYDRPPPRTADPLLGIGVFARRSHLSQKALRLYERQRLLVPAEVDGDTGYRRYRESQLRTARLVVLLRRLDMPLAEVRAIVGSTREEAVDRIDAYWRRFEDRVAHQRELVAHLRVRLSDEGSTTMFDEVHQRDVPEQLVLTEQRHLLVHELPDWLPAAIGRLIGTAETFGGIAGPVFVVYHGQVNQDSDGPVEVCVPISAAPDADVATRVEPAHAEAYVRLTKAQVEFPQILSAYDAVAQWIDAKGRSMSGPPREVYFNDFAAASSDDEVCDVAFPIG
jgi:DNA-binding transcriptional MerR regulator/effector-binding domain-containing protein